MEKIALSPRQAADALSISKTKVYQLINTGALPARSVGGRTLIAVADLNRFLSSQPRLRLSKTSLNTGGQS